MVGEQCDIQGPAAFDMPMEHVIQMSERKLNTALGQPPARVAALHDTRDIVEVNLTESVPGSKPHWDCAANHGPTGGMPLGGV